MREHEDCTSVPSLERLALTLCSMCLLFAFVVGPAWQIPMRLTQLDADVKAEVVRERDLQESYRLLLAEHQQLVSAGAK